MRTLQAFFVVFENDFTLYKMIEQYLYDYASEVKYCDCFMCESFRETRDFAGDEHY